MTRPGSVPLAPEHDVVDFLATTEAADLTNCDREPIHLPGAIQPHGVLLAVREADLTIRQVSENCGAHLGVDASALIGAPLARALGAEPVARLRAALEDPGTSGADPLVVRLPSGVLEATWHRIDEFVIFELEPDDSEPAVSSALFQDLRHAMNALQTAGGVQKLCETFATEARRLTGYDRVMVYRFHADEHGEVVAEDREPGVESYLGLHYPASDIPRQARRLYELKQLGIIADVAYEPAALLGAPDGERTPLNLSFAGLRSVSPIHLAYLRGMGVQATLTVSLMRGSRMWGMLTCHHRAPRRLNAQRRAACRLLGQLFTLKLVIEEQQERQTYAARLAEVGAQLVSGMSAAKRPADALAATASLPLELVSADGMIARIDGRMVTAGAVPPHEAVEPLLARLRARDDPSGLVSDELGHLFSELAPFAEHAAGILALPLSTDPDDVIVWFRGELVRTVTWSGDPRKPMSGDPRARPGEPGFAQLGPRESFDAWTEEVRGRCRPWLAAEVDAARELAAAVPELLLARARDRLAHLALYDGLTGLPNRALLLKKAAQALDAPRSRGRRVALLFVDLDRFKIVNDSLGHAAGDAVLRQAAARLKEATRETDTVARLGGDEFVVLCDDIATSQAERLAQRIVEAFQPPFSLDAHEAAVTASVGVVIAEEDATPAELLHDADTAMYRAKHGGRNAATPFTPEMRASTLRHVRIQTGLRPAFERGELRVHYQPIYTIAGVLTGFEALARWPLEGRETISPDEFIPVAESTGLIAPLTAWVLDDGLRALAKWRRRRPALDLRLSVNLSATQVTPALGGIVGDALTRHGLPPAALCLEITEAALVADNDLTRRILHRLRDQGIQLSIDDFGTGFSSLAYLVRLPIHEIKIDRAFISGLPSRASDATVVASVVGLAHQLGLRAVAEGVETDGQLEAVRRLGCDLAQGYLLGRPRAPDRIDDLVEETPELRVA